MKNYFEYSCLTSYCRIKVSDKKRIVIFHCFHIWPPDYKTQIFSYDTLLYKCISFLITSDLIKMFTGSPKPTVTIIAEARQTCSPSPEIHSNPSLPDAEKDLRQDVVSNFVESSKSVNSSSEFRTQSKSDGLETLLIPSTYNPTLSESGFVFCSNSSNSNSNSNQKNSDPVESNNSTKGGPSYPPFPCPFCDRAYTSWGFRRRHIKAVHTISPRLSCKWCLQVCQYIYYFFLSLTVRI